MSARANMRMGQTTQLSRRERARSLLSLKTSGIFEYWTFAKGEYIMRMSPAAMGIFVVPTLMESSATETPGKAAPMPTPVTMARNIQSVSRRSNAPSLAIIPFPFDAISSPSKNLCR